MPASTPSVVMTKKGGKKYRCYLPEEGTAGEAASEADALEAAPSVASYLMPIKGTCFYRLEGWWTYEFCFLQRRGSQVVRRRCGSASTRPPGTDGLGPGRLTAYCPDPRPSLTACCPYPAAWD
jgi:protein OS-9